MKRIIALSLFVLVTSLAIQAQTKLTINFKFLNIVEGYDHTSRTQVFVDGELLATSEEFLESKGGKMKVVIPKGKHDVLVMNQALYEGEWENHTIENNYSIDCLYEEAGMKRGKKATLTLIFDIDSGTEVKWGKSKE